MLRYEEIQEKLDKGGSFQHEMLKLLCEIADTLLYIRDSTTQKTPIYNKDNGESKLEEPVVPKKRGRPKKDDDEKVYLDDDIPKKKLGRPSKLIVMPYPSYNHKS